MWAFLSLLLVAAPRSVLAQQTCTSNDDCSGQVCGYDKVDGSANLVCCSGRVNEYVSRNEYGFTSSGSRSFCTGLSDGETCGDLDEVCLSGACVLGTCQVSKLEDNEVCKLNNDCLSSACAYSAVDGSASVACCASGQMNTFVSRNEYGFETSGNRYFCTGLENGAACGDIDEVCASGACVLGTCAATKLGADGQCNRNNDCENGVCGYDAVDASASSVCCSSGEVFSEYVSRNEYGFETSGRRNFCTGQPDGTKCAQLSDACSSSNCICGICEEAGFECSTGICGPEGCLQELLQPGSRCIADNNCILGECGDDGTCSYLANSAPCTEGNDDQCSSQVCSREKAEQGASFVCCASSEQLTSDNDASLSACTEVGFIDDPCFDDGICRSNICVDNMCKSGLQKEGESCEKAEHCHSGACTNSKCAPFPTLEERNSYFNVRAVCPMDNIDNSNSGGAITLNVYGDSTDRAWSSDLPNEVRTDKRDSTGTANVLEGQKLLDALEGCADGSSVVAQRQGDNVCFSYQYRDVGDEGTTATCRSKCIRIGGNGSFETYDELTTDIVGGFGGVPVTAYYFGESRDCRVEVSMGAASSADNDLQPDEEGGTSSSQQPDEVSPEPDAGGDESSPSFDGDGDRDMSPSSNSETQSNQALRVHFSLLSLIMMCALSC